MGSFQENVQLLSTQFVPLIMAVIFHEFAHGFIALKWGDTTARDEGRLTLNPVPHIDPVGTLLFPIMGMLMGWSFLIGWARPVPINPTRFKKFRHGLFWVSLAGPGMNFSLAIVSAAIACAIIAWVPQTFYLHQPLRLMAQASVGLNFMLGLFNLIPIPPLDGSKIIESFLPLRAMQKYERISQYGYFILLALMMTGAISFLSYPIRLATGITLILMSKLFGLPTEALFQ